MRESQYRVRWNAAGVTRVDMNSAKGTGQTLWISKGAVLVADNEGEGALDGNHRHALQLASRPRNS